MGNQSKYSLKSIWGSGTSIYAVGMKNPQSQYPTGIILQYNGSAWNEVYEHTKTLSGIWGISDADIFVVGGAGTILRGTGDSWSFVGSGTYNFNDVWGTSSFNVYAIGGVSGYEADSGVILNYNGTWHTTSTGSSMTGIWGTSSSDDIFAVGWAPSDFGTTILHYSAGATPTLQPTPTYTQIPDETATPTPSTSSSPAPTQTLTPTASPTSTPTSTTIMPTYMPTYAPTSTASVTPTVTPTPSPTPAPVDSTPWYKGTWFGIWIAAFWLVAAGSIAWLLKQRRPPANPKKKNESSQQAKGKKK